MLLLDGSRFAPGQSAVLMLALFGLGCAITTLLANYVIPRLLPRLHDEDRWTVGHQAA